MMVNSFDLNMALYKKQTNKLWNKPEREEGADRQA